MSIVHPTGKFDNSAREYQHIEALPLAAAMGAEIRGVQLSDLNDATFEEIQDALFRHKMIYFRNQEMSHGDHENFSARFGEFAEDAYTKGIEGHENVQPLIREADADSAMVFGSGWHTDSPFLNEPPAITMLRSVQIPPYGGDTLWANTALAYQMLSDKMKQVLDDLNVHMSMKNVLKAAQDTMKPDDPSPLARVAATKDAGPLPEEIAVKVRGNYHPIVRTHPVTGEKALYCDGTYAVGFEGMEEAEAMPIVNFLSQHITQAAFTCRLRWEPNTLALWDNRICLHQAFNDYQGFRREMYRTTVAGEKPV